MEDQQHSSAGFSAPLTYSARIISVIFHPLFVGVWMMIYVTYLHPTIFLAVSDKSRLFKLITFINNTVVFPLLVVLLLKGLGFSASIYLRTQKERIIPYIASSIFFFWTWNVFNHQPDAPQILKDMCQGMFFASSAALVLNSYYKISMHAIAMGGLIGLMLVISWTGMDFSLWPMALGIFLCGLVCSARLMISDHRPFDIISGIVVGLLAQLVAWWL